MGLIVAQRLIGMAFYFFLLYTALWPYMVILTVARYVPRRLGRLELPTKPPDIRVLLLCWPLVWTQVFLAAIFSPLLIFDYLYYLEQIGELGKSLPRRPDDGVKHNVLTWLYSLYLMHPLITPDLCKPDDCLLAAAKDAPSYLPKEPLPVRKGPRPDVMNGLPQRQVEQLAPKEVTDAVCKHVFEETFKPEDCVEVGVSILEGTGSTGVRFKDEDCCGGEVKKMRLEFLHQHSIDKSWHALLSPRDAIKVLQAGWGERGPPFVAQGMGAPGCMLLYAPRDAHEREVFTTIVKAGYRYSSGGKADAQ